ncbi:MAG: choice-of-anchor C family protein [Propionivibrio sp.]|nr:choice-of-anchor C family protein [Propionivibrio sp.]
MHTKLFAVVALVLAQSVSANAPNLITNGGFEDTTFSGTFDPYSAGSGALTGWTIVTGSVDLIHTYWTPAGGAYSLDLSGNEDGVISQSFATVIGQRYLVSFAMAGNPDDTMDPVKTMQVGLSQGPLWTFDTTGRTHADMGWETKSFDFIAAGTSSTLSFASLNDSAYGAALDNISVTAIPEPESFAMFLAGLGLIAAVARRRAGLPK